jgi:hypothetical protein
MPAGLGELMTRRRLGGAALILGGLVIAAAVLWPALHSDEPARARAAPVRIVSVPQFGLAFGHPRSWSRKINGRVIRLRSPDGTAILTFSSFPGREPKRVKAALAAALKTRFSPARVVRDGPGLLGARRVDSFELSGSDPSGRVRALAMVDDTPYRTYTITLLTPAKPSRKVLLEVSRILASVQFTKPESLASKQ